MPEPVAVSLDLQWCNRVLSTIAITVCKMHEVNFLELSPDQRKFITHYRCEACKLQPLYLVDFGNVRRPKCGRCGFAVNFLGGKYGKIRKTIAIQLYSILKSE